MVMSLGFLKPVRSDVSLRRAARDRFGLFAACVAAIGIGLAVGDPSSFLERDADLGRLLRGMAMIKGVLCVIAFGAAAWRFGSATAPAVALGYIACVTVMAGAATLVWELTALAFTSITFHGAWIALAWIALCDDAVPRALGKRA